MHQLKIRVKGDIAAAERAMASRGLRTSGPWRAQLVGVTATATTWAVRPSRAARAAIVSWFCEPAVCADGPGFPAGTLLHHS
jgi:hypothetical protein